MRRVSLALAVAVLGGGALCASAAAETSPPGNLGNGLSRLVQPPGSKLRPTSLAVRDAQGRVMVDVYASDGSSLAAVRRRTEAAGLKTVLQSAAHQAIEGFVAVGDIASLAKTAGVASVSQVLRPYTKVGAATSQGVHAQRADRLPRGIDGRGITVGALSDSYDIATETTSGQPLTVHAAQDVATGDLPPDVTVLQEDPTLAGADEGRAMLQIIHDVAPRAHECFATAQGGDLNFAANIVALGDKSGPCKADVIVDDVGYFDEPFFSRGPISDAVDAVAAKGVHYFSSAGNGSSQQGYSSPLRVVAPTDARDRSNIDLSGVDPKLYAGGFQDFDTGAGVDVAQDIAVGAVDGKPGPGIINMQWDDPVDPSGAPLSEPILGPLTGEFARDQVATIPFDGTAGQTIRAEVDGIPSTSTDLILTLKDPAGNILQQIDTGSSPETVVQELPVTGRYTFEVSGFNHDFGDFTFEVRRVLGNSHTTTDLNALFFTTDGQFLGAASDLNKLSGKPFEVFGFNWAGPLQLVIAKGSTDGDAKQVRYEMYDGMQADEYVQPMAPTISGHPLARGATAVAAYDPFRPLLPEDYTSVGGDLPIYWDSAGNRLPKPDIRRAPQVAATDGGNTTFFSRDSALDPDTQPNFFGTSASAPHAAAIAALALQAAGGPGRIKPDAMRALLQRSAFPHDLDQQHSEAAGRGLTISADGEYGDERRPSRPTWTTPGSMNNPRFFTVRYSGPGSITSLTFDGIGANPTGLGTFGPFSSGIVFDPRPFAGIPARISLTGDPGLYTQGFPFTVGAASPGIAPSDVSAKFAVPGIGDANGQQYERMTVSFAPGKLAGGRGVAFGIDRDEAVTAYGDAQDGNSADQLGQGVLFPSGRTVGPGLIYSARTSDGRAIVGTLRNRIGAGWTAVDGYGYLNAQAAVSNASR